MEKDAEDLLVKLWLIPYDETSKEEVAKLNQIPSIRLHLKSSKTWKNVISHLQNKWKGIKDLDRRIQIFFLDHNACPCLDLVSTFYGISIKQSLCSTISYLLSYSPDEIPLIQLYYHLKTEILQGTKVSDDNIYKPGLIYSTTSTTSNDLDIPMNEIVGEATMDGLMQLFTNNEEESHLAAPAEHQKEEDRNRNSSHHHHNDHHMNKGIGNEDIMNEGTNDLVEALGLLDDTSTSTPPPPSSSPTPNSHTLKKDHQNNAHTLNTSICIPIPIPKEEAQVQVPLLSIVKEESDRLGKPTKSSQGSIKDDTKVSATAIPGKEVEEKKGEEVIAIGKRVCFSNEVEVKEINTKRVKKNQNGFKLANGEIAPIIRLRKRKPWLRRITPTFVSPLSKHN